MDAVQTPKISLRIHGNPKSNAGYGPILTLNPLFPPLRDNDYPGMQANPYYYVIHIGPNYTQFTLVHNGVSSYGASRQGTLKMAMGLPKGYSLKPGISPLGLLSQMRDIFVANYLTQMAPNAYQFKQDINNQELTSALNEMLELYPLEPTHLPHWPMSEGSSAGSAVIIVGKEKIEQFFKDVQYKEFSQYHEIVVAEQGGDLSGFVRNLSDITIPRKANYQLVVNGVNCELPGSDFIRVSLCGTLKKNPSYYEDDSISFKISEVVSGKKVNGVHFNSAEERIECTLKVKPRQVKLIVSVECNGSCDYNKLYLSIGSSQRKISNSNCPILFEGEDLSLLNSPVTCDYLASDFTVVNRNPKIETDAKGNRTLKIQLDKCKTSSVGSASSSVSTVSSTGLKLELGISDTIGPKSAGTKNTFDVRVRTSSGKLLKDSVTFKRVTSGDRKTYLKGDMELPSFWKNERISSVSVSDLGIKSDSVRPDNNSNKYQCDQWEKDKTTTPKTAILRVVLVAVVALIIGFFLGHFLWPKSEVVTTPAPLGTASPSSSQKDKLEEIPQYVKCLKSDTVTFEYVRKAIMDFKGVGLSSNPDFEKMLKYYGDIVGYIETGNFDSIKSFANRPINCLTEQQRSYLRCIYEGYGNQKYDANGRRDAKAQFDQTYNQMKSFKDLFQIWEDHRRQVQAPAQQSLSNSKTPPSSKPANNVETR